MRNLAYLAMGSWLAAACSGGDMPGMGDDDVGDDDAPPPPLEEMQCEGSTVWKPPADAAARGPWQVGARTVTVGTLTAEVWYPAAAGSEAGLESVRYDIREHLPEAERGKIPDADNPWQLCDCFRDLPLDDAHGPYPVIVFVHGTAGFRTQSLTQMTHWASRGFVVVVADNPGMELKDIMAFQFGGDQAADARALLDALAAPADGLAFLTGHLDMQRVGLAGHSAGGGAIAGLGARAGVRVVIPMASRGTGMGTASTLILGAMDDSVAQYTQTKMGFASSPKKRRLVGIDNAGHLAFSDLCYIARDQGGILQVALDHGVEVNDLIANLARDGCMEGQLPAERGWQIINDATSQVLEEALLCGSVAPDLGDLMGRYPEVAELIEEL